MLGKAALRQADGAEAFLRPEEMEDSELGIATLTDFLLEIADGSRKSLKMTDRITRVKHAVDKYQ